ncbi:isotrichodermin C-15 hydroxylase [Xylariales sp. AK1849]|nr:isotrichodermin C-15 hydroxylase [Xylariales sp. AK1849]
MANAISPYQRQKRPAYRRLTRQVRPVVRFTPNDVSYINSSAWKEIYGHRQFGAWNLMVADAPDHARQRKQLAPAFSEKALREQEPLILEYINLLMKRLDETAGQAVDLSDLFNFTTFDIVGKLAFGRNEFQSLDKMRAHPWVGMIYSLMPSMAIFGAKIKEEVDGHVRSTIEFVDKRLGTPSHKPNFINYILRDTKAGPSSMLENREIYSTSASIVIAGSETRATSLAGTVYLLLKNPDKLTKLRDEIRNGSISEADINPRAVAEKKYLRAVLDEVQRVYPAVPNYAHRLVPEGGCVVDGKFIPPNTLIGVTPYAAYRSERNFTDAKSFVPERWLGHERYNGDDREAYWPFGFGPLNCIGMNMAHLEMRIILSKLIWNFDLELLPESGDWLDQEAIIIWHRRPLMVKLTKRRVAGLNEQSFRVLAAA